MERLNKSKIKRDIERNYKILGLIDDFMVGLEFLIGSIEFLPHNSYIIGVYLFIIGSFQILMVPTIKLAKDIHLKIKKLDKL